MTIPLFNGNGELVAGEHHATLKEIEKDFGLSSERRKNLMRGLCNAVSNLKKAGVKTIWVDGSFITDKVEPNDIDGCWEYTNSVDHKVLDKVFLGSREKMKKKYGLDFFISNIIEGGSNLPFPKFFQVNREGKAKGILGVKL